MEVRNKGAYKNLENQIQKLVKHARQGSFRTRDRYYEAAQRFCQFLADRYNLQKFSNIGPKHITNYVREMQSKGLATSTIRTDLSAIRFFHDQLPNARYSHLPTNDELKKNGVNLEQRPGYIHRAWTPNEYQKMQQMACMEGNDRISDIMALARHQGLRVHEVTRLDRAAAEAALRTGVLHIKGKNGKERDIPVSREGRKVLEKCIRHCERGEKLFIKKDEPTHVVIKEAQTWIEKAREQCRDEDRRQGLEKKEMYAEKVRWGDLTLHGLRHAYARERFAEIQNKIREENPKWPKKRIKIEAKKQLSHELGHERTEIVDVYLQ